MGKGSPKAPDPAATAQAQGAANLQTAIAQGYLNNPTMISPYGTVSRTQTGTVKVGNEDVPLFTQNVTLSPSQQRQLDMTNALQEQALGIGSGVLGNVGEATSKPFTLEGLPTAPGSGDFSKDRDLATQALIDRNQPMMDRQRESLDSKLYNQGIMPGSEAYKNAQDDLARQENDFRLAAINAGGAEQSRLFGLGTTARQNALQERAYERSQPINEYATLLGLGGNIQTPQFQPVPVDLAAPDVQGAYNTAYAGKLNAYNQRQALLGNLIGAGGAIGAGAAMSDVRLKENIRFAGIERDIPIYHFSYRNDPSKARYRGVVAQDILDIMPEAVIEHNGYLAVDYDRIGIEFGRIH